MRIEKGVMYCESQTEFESELRRHGGSSDIQTSSSGRYPRAFGMPWGESITRVVVHAWIARPGSDGVGRIHSDSYDCSTPEGIDAMYASVARGGGQFNDSTDAEQAVARRAREEEVLHVG